MYKIMIGQYGKRMQKLMGAFETAQSALAWLHATYTPEADFWKHVTAIQIGKE